MKILVLNGSPHQNGSTAFMINAFKQGAEEAGHDVEVVDVAQMDIEGCRACEYCHTKGNSECIQDDDMQEIYPKILSADMVVFASPIYYFGLSSQLQSVIHRTYSFGIPNNVDKVVLILSSGSDNVYDGAIYEYKHGLSNYWGAKDMGIFTAHGFENKSAGKRDELYQFGKSL